MGMLEVEPLQTEMLPHKQSTNGSVRQGQGPSEGCVHVESVRIVLPSTETLVENREKAETDKVRLYSYIRTCLSLL